MAADPGTQPLQYAGTPPLATTHRRRFALGLASCGAAVVSYGIHATQFWPGNPAPEALLVGAWMLSVFGIILALIGVWDKRERHPLDFLGLFMNVLSFVVPCVAVALRGVMVRKPEQSSNVLIVIAVFKLFKAGSLILIALAVHHLLRGDTTEILTHWAHEIRVDPHNRHIHGFIGAVTGISRRKLEALSIGTLFYAAIFLTEGIGLLLQKRWAEYFTTISTAGLLPLEIYELVIHPRPVKALVLIANVAIVVYLIIRLRRTSPRTHTGDAHSLANEPAA